MEVRITASATIGVVEQLKSGLPSDGATVPLGPRASSPQRCASAAPELHALGMGMDGQVFFFFSNRFGCLGSIFISVVLSALLIE